MCNAAIIKAASPLALFASAFKGPRPPATPAARQAPRAPDAATTGSRSEEALARRQTIASMVTTNPNGMGSAPTVGKRTLGA
jgi:hypothetical protein